MARKAQHLGRDARVAPPPPGGVLHFGKPPERKWSTPMFLAPHFRDLLEGANLHAVGQKTAVKVYHAEKTLQLFDILRGWAKFDFGGVIGRKGCSCH